MERTRYQRICPRREPDGHANSIALHLGFLHLADDLMQLDCQEIFERKMVIGFPVLDEGKNAGNAEFRNVC